MSAYVLQIIGTIFFSPLKLHVLDKEGYNFTQDLIIHKNTCNTTNHFSTGYSPAFLHFGQAMIGIFDIFKAPQSHAILFLFI